MTESRMPAGCPFGPGPDAANPELVGTAPALRIPAPV